MSVLRMLTVFVLLLPSWAVAKEIEVRAGEHVGFTRLVLHLPEAMKWNTQKIENKVSVTVAKKGVEFDVSHTFTRIGRERVASIRSIGGKLEIELGCDCEITSHLNGDRMVVLDVSDAKAASKSTVPSPRIKSLNLVSSDRLSTGELVEALHAPKGPPSFKANGADEAKLLEHLSRAASLGLLELADAPQYSNSVAVPSQDYTAVEASNLSAHLGLAAVAVEHFDTVGQSESGLVCPSDDKLNIAQWSAHQEFFDGLVALRRKLGGEVSPLEEDVAVSLAKHYLHFTFSAEALELLQQVERNADIELLIALAHVIDGTADSFPVNLSRYTTCNSWVSMWALLSSDSAQQVSSVHPKAIISAFSELPVALQTHIGPRLAEALLGQNLADEAQHILRLVELQQRRHSPEYNFAEAQSQSEQGHVESAAVKLRETVGADSSMSPDALVALIENEISTGKSPSPETIELWTSYVHQFRNTEVAPRLRRAMMSGHIKANQYQEAWQLLETSTKLNEEVPGFLDEFLDSLVMSGSDFEFLRHGSRLKGQVADLSPDVAQRVAKRFSSMGFSGLATEFSDLLDERRGDSEALSTRLQEEGPMHEPIEETLRPPVQVSLSTGYTALSESRGLRFKLEEILEETALDRSVKR